MGLMTGRRGNDIGGAGDDDNDDGDRDGDCGGGCDDGYCD